MSLPLSLSLCVSVVTSSTKESAWRAWPTLYVHSSDMMLSEFLSLSVCLSVCLSLSLSLFLSHCLSGNEQYHGISLEGLANVICTQLGYDAEWVALFVSLSLFPSLCLFLCLFVSLSVSLFVSHSLFVCLSVSLSLSTTFYERLIFCQLYFTSRLGAYLISTYNYVEGPTMSSSFNCSGSESMLSECDDVDQNYYGDYGYYERYGETDYCYNPAIVSCHPGEWINQVFAIIFTLCLD